MRFTERSDFGGGGPIYRGGLPKKGVARKKGVVFLRGGGDTPMPTMERYSFVIVSIKQKPGRLITLSYKTTMKSMERM